MTPLDIDLFLLWIDQRIVEAEALMSRRDPSGSEFWEYHGKIEAYKRVKKYLTT